MTPKEIYESALGLNAEEREALGELLLASLEPATEPGAEAFQSVLRRRAAEIDAGRVTPVDLGDDVADGLQRHVSSGD